MSISLLATRCGNCRLLVKEGDKYSCPRNKHGIPEKVPENWATYCNIHEPGAPGKKQSKTKQSRIFFTRWFGVHLSPDYRTVMIVSKNGYKLAVDPSQTNEEKIVVTSVRKG